MTTLSIFDPDEVAVIDPATDRQNLDLTDQRPRPDQTARIFLRPEPRRPWGFRGTRRQTRSRALLVAATWPGGLR